MRGTIFDTRLAELDPEEMLQFSEMKSFCHLINHIHLCMPIFSEIVSRALDSIIAKSFYTDRKHVLVR